MAAEDASMKAMLGVILVGRFLFTLGLTLGPRITPGLRSRPTGFRRMACASQALGAADFNNWVIRGTVCSMYETVGYRLTDPSARDQNRVE
jgi:hypothetical protein